MTHKLTHDDIVHVIMVRARRLKLLVHYCTNSRCCTGKPGLPDLTIAGPYGTAWVEVKGPGDNLTPGQTTWVHMLLAGGQTVYVVREEHLHDGTIDALLERLSGPHSELS